MSPVRAQSPMNLSSVACGSSQYSRIITGSGRFTAISPTSPAGARLPSLRITATSCPGMGRPIDPGLISITSWQLPTTRFASVWPYTSLMVTPRPSFAHSSTSDPSGSPPLETVRSWKSYLCRGSGTSRIIFRADGGMSVLRTLCRAIRSKALSGSNLPAGSTTTGSP